MANQQPVYSAFGDFAVNSKLWVECEDILDSLQSSNDRFDHIGVYPARGNICTTKEEGEATEEGMSEVCVCEVNR
jgi:hypothetical protein